MKERRIKLGITQQQIARDLNINQSIVSKVENGFLKYDRIDKYLKRFEIKPKSKDLKALRKELFITQKEIGKIFNVNKSVISLLENGKYPTKDAEFLEKKITIYLLSLYKN